MDKVGRHSIIFWYYCVIVVLAGLRSKTSETETEKLVCRLGALWSTAGAHLWVGNFSLMEVMMSCSTFWSVSVTRSTGELFCMTLMSFCRASRIIWKQTCPVISEGHCLAFYWPMVLFTFARFQLWDWFVISCSFFYFYQGWVTENEEVWIVQTRKCGVWTQWCTRRCDVSNSIHRIDSMSVVVWQPHVTARYSHTSPAFLATSTQWSIHSWKGSLMLMAMSRSYWRWEGVGGGIDVHINASIDSLCLILPPVLSIRHLLQHASISGLARLRLRFFHDSKKDVKWSRMFKNGRFSRWLSRHRHSTSRASRKFATWTWNMHKNVKFRPPLRQLTSRWAEMQGAGLPRPHAWRPLVCWDDESIVPCSLARTVRNGVICRRTSARHKTKI